jgi:serine/threonine protein kinase
LFFPDLSQDGFVIGAPTDHRFPTYLKELKRAVDTIHGAGVVHLDLYPSNIMWKFDDSDVKIRIIDWDVAHCVCEELAEAVGCAKRGGHETTLNFELDNQFIAVQEWAWQVKDSDPDVGSSFHKLSTASKDEIDKAFFALLSLKARNERS